VLLGLGQRGWALGVAAQAKARALAHRLGGGSDAAAAAEGAYEEVCGAWWAEVQEHARGQAAAAAGSALRVLEYSLLSDDRLVIWVLSGAGDLLGSATVRTKAYRRDAVGRVVFEDGLARMHKDVEVSTELGGKPTHTMRFGGHKLGIQVRLQEARGSMKVRGREIMASSDVELAREADASDSTADLPSQRGKVTCRVCVSKPCTCAADEVRERMLLRELYAALVAPVEEHLTGAEEVLIVPHKELFEVPWAALIDAHGHFLIEHHVLRVAPSLRVAQQAAVSAAKGSARRPGHIVLVGNPLPIRSGFRSLPCAQQEAQGVHDILKRVNVLVKSEHFFMSDSYPKATKANVKTSLKGAGWAHLACHGDIDTDSLVLAVPESQSDPDHAQPDLSMLEVQGSDEAADKRERVRLAEGATVVLSACNTGRGEIKAEGVVGLARGFLLAGAAAAVVSLWSVDDGSTAALMEQMYQYLGSIKGCTVPQALRLAMLRMLRLARPALYEPVPHGQETDAADLPGAEAEEGGRGGGGELGGFIKLEGGGSRSADGGGGVVPAVQGFLDILEGVGQGSSIRDKGAPAIEMSAAVRQFMETTSAEEKLAMFFVERSRMRYLAPARGRRGCARYHYLYTHAPSSAERRQCCAHA
jgi:CHAT domain-containing protein